MGVAEGGNLDPIDHPDLLHLDRLMSARIEDTLQAEQFAARVAARRRLTIRDVLLELEDRNAAASLNLADGRVLSGNVASVGLDHAVIAESGASHVVSIVHIVSVSA
ncbi:MAG TPA: hypothetical protein VGC47_06900 [Acidimicrobiia bacterium]